MSRRGLGRGDLAHLADVAVAFAAARAIVGRGPSAPRSVEHARPRTPSVGGGSASPAPPSCPCRPSRCSSSRRRRRRPRRRRRTTPTPANGSAATFGRARTGEVDARRPRPTRAAGRRSSRRRGRAPRGALPRRRTVSGATALRSATSARASPASSATRPATSQPAGDDREHDVRRADHVARSGRHSRPASGRARRSRCVRDACPPPPPPAAERAPTALPIAPGLTIPTTGTPRVRRHALPELTAPTDDGLYARMHRSRT